MKTLSQEIMTLDFRRVGKNFALAAAVVLVVCVGLGAFLLWPQLVEAWALLAHGQGPLEWRLDMLEDAWEWSLAGYGGGVLSAVGLGARTALLVSGLVLVAVAAGYWLLVALWLYQLANRAEMGGALWALLGLVGNLFDETQKTPIAFDMDIGFAEHFRTLGFHRRLWLGHS